MAPRVKEGRARPATARGRRTSERTKERKNELPHAHCAARTARSGAGYGVMPGRARVPKTGCRARPPRTKGKLARAHKC